jgi:predicted RNA-binding Zn-ribbon protein involved in translation (DUF1610 family)
MKDTTRCFRCTEKVRTNIDDYAVIDGHVYCESCVVDILSEDLSFTCNMCGKYEHSAFGNLTDRGVVCDECFFEIHIQEAKDNVE